MELFCVARETSRTELAISKVEISKAMGKKLYLKARTHKVE